MNTIHDTFQHIMARGAIHFFASSSVFMALYFLADWIERKHEDIVRYLIAGLIITAFFSFHEIYDVGMGNNGMLKGFTDVASWMLGCAASGYGLYRFRNKH